MRKRLKKKKIIRKKVAVAMSGGVDSSVAAFLLKKQGFDVIGVFMRLWEPRINADSDADLGGFKNQCCSSDAEARAKKVAEILNIPFRVFNFEKEFKKRIVDCFLKESKKGLTPNPCVICNKEIKFGFFLEKALKLNADYIATGHYARIKIQNEKFKAQNYRSKFKIYKLLKAKDREKDQSYFLWKLKQGQLRKVLFPIGDYSRSEVESLAKKLKLPFAGVKKSQEICFIKNTVNDFFKKYLKTKPGKIIDEKGKILGSHQGLWFYTIGQRKGIKLPAGPFYVLNKDLKRNALIVTKNEKNLYKKEIIVKNCNFISDNKIELPFKIAMKIRYRHCSVLATIYKIEKNKYHIRFNRVQRAVTPGQSAVFYLPAVVSAKEMKGSEVLGGGIIYQ